MGYIATGALMNPMAAILGLLYIGIATSACVSMLLGRKNGRSRLLSVLVSLAAAMIWLRLMPPAPIAQLAPILVAVFIMPGYLLMELLFPSLSRDLSGLERGPVLFGLTMGVWALITAPAFRAQWPSDLVIGLILASDVVGSLFLFKKKSHRQGDKPLPGMISQTRPATTHVVTLCIILAVISGLVGFSSQFQRNDFDSSFHLAGYNKIAEGERIIGGNPFLGAGYSYLPQYAANSWYLAFGLAARMSQTSVAWVYVALAALMTPLVFLTFYFLLHVLVRNVRVAMIGTLLVIGPWIYMEAVRWGPGMGNFYFQFLPFPFTCVQLILFPLWMAFCFRYVSTRRASDGVMTAILALATFWQHPESLVVIPFSIGVVFLFSLLSRQSRREKMNTFILMIVIVILAAVVAILTSTHPVPGGRVLLKGAGYRDGLFGPKELLLKNAWIINGDLYALHPRILFGTLRGILDWIVAPLSFLGLVLWTTKRNVFQKVNVGETISLAHPEGRDNHRRLAMTAVAVYVGPLFMIFNPIVVPSMIKILGSSFPVLYIPDEYLMMTRVFEFVLIASVLALANFDRHPFKRRRILGRISVFAIIAATLGLLLFSTTIRSVMRDIVTENSNPSILAEAQAPLFKSLAMFESGIVAIDPEQSEYLVMNTPHYVVSSGRMPIERQADNEKIIHFSVSPEEMKRLLLKYECLYVVVPRNESLIKNGGFAKNGSNWDATSCLLESVPGGQKGNCLRLTRIRYDSQFAYQDITCEPGHFYRIDGFVKSGTSGHDSFGLNVFRHQASGNGEFSFHGLATDTWVKYSIIFRAEYADLCLLLVKNSATPGSILFDTILCYEVRPADPSAVKADKRGDGKFLKFYVGEDDRAQEEWAPHPCLQRFREHLELFDEVLTLGDYSVFRVKFGQK